MHVALLIGGLAELEPRTAAFADTLMAQGQKAGTDPTRHFVLAAAQ